MRFLESIDREAISALLDALGDSFFPVLERLDDRIEALDTEIFERTAPAQLEEITALRRKLVEVRRVVTPQRDLLARGIDDILEIPGLEADSRNYFRCRSPSSSASSARTSAGWSSTSTPPLLRLADA